MATDSPMEDAPPVTTDGELQPPSVVEQWTPKDLFDFAPIQKILWNDKNRATFQNAEISGRAFLRDGDVRDFWLHQCGLPIGLSGDLAELAQTLKNMGKEKSRGNAFHLGSVEPADAFTVESPSPPGQWIIEIARLNFLHGLLWGKEDSLRDTVLCEFQHPSWNRDTNPHINDDMRTAVKLSLSGISSGAQLEGDSCLPCEANELLVRGAYREMYDILLRAQEGRLKDLQEWKAIPHRKKIILILGQPGIGKTWFLTYVLVRRLLEGKPTIFQLADFDGASNTSATHYLIDGYGIRRMDSPSVGELRNPDIWVLADQKPVGAPRRAGDHNWLVVVTSSPREDNYHYVVKQYRPQKYYLPTWDWQEVVAAA
jgi:hypothetical protein